MYDFLDRLVTIALPRVRDFRGLNPKSFDGRGNYRMGIKEHIVFPEIDYDKIDQIWGMDIMVCTTAKTDDEARELLAASTSRSGSERERAKRGKVGEQMAKTSSIEKNKRRARLVKQYAAKRAKLKAIAQRHDVPLEERFAARSSLPSCRATPSATRIRNRCEITGRPRALLSQAEDVPHRAARTRLQGQIPGLVKSSW